MKKNILILTLMLVITLLFPMAAICSEKDREANVIEATYVEELMSAGDAADSWGEAKNRRSVRSAKSGSGGYGYYGSQLSDIQKGLYDTLRTGEWIKDNNANNYIKEYTFSPAYTFQNVTEDFANSNGYKTLQTDVYSAFDAYIYDYPEDAFWIKSPGISLSYSYYFDRSAGQYVFSISEISLTAAERWQEAKSDLFQLSSSTNESVTAIRSSAGYGSMTTGEKLKAVHDYICILVRYGKTDTVIESQHTPYGAYVYDHSVVCEGYAKLFKILTDKLGIAENILVSGTAKTSGDSEGAHMWNAVSLDGHWYLLDATWDDQDQDQDQIPLIYYDYFLAGSGSYGFLNSITVGGQHEVHSCLSEGEGRLLHRFCQKPCIIRKSGLLLLRQPVQWQGRRL